MKYVLLVTFFFGFASAQTQPSNELDSLRNSLRNKSLGIEERLKIYIALGEYYLQVDPRQTVLYADSALILADNQNKKYFSRLYLLKGNGSAKQSLHTKALENYTTALDYALEHDDQKSLADIYSELADLANDTGEAVKALELYQKALDINIMRKDTVGIIERYNAIGIIYLDKREFDKALHYYKRAVALNNAIGNITLNARLTNNIGLIFQELDQYDSALIYFNRALSYISLQKNKFGYALINNNIGICYRDQKKYDLALKHFNIAKTLQAELGDEYGMGLANDNIAQTYIRQGKYRTSIAFLQEGLKHAEKAKNPELLNNLCLHLAKCYENLNDYKSAYLFQKQARMYEDSVQAKSLSRSLAELEVKYQVKQQQAENELLKAENRFNLSAISRKNFQVIAIAVGLLLVLVVLSMLYIFYRKSRKTNLLLTKKKTEIEMQNVKLAEAIREKNSLMNIVAHDLRAPLNKVKGLSELVTLEGNLSEDQQEYLHMMNAVTEQGRRLVGDLLTLNKAEENGHILNIEKIQMDELMHELIKEFSKAAHDKNIEIVMESPQSDAILNTDRDCLKRILDNLLSNAVKFSPFGKKVYLKIATWEANCLISIRDEGPGFTEEDKKNLFKKFQRLSARPTAGEASSGLGLAIVKQLALQLKGDVLVNSIPGKGAEFVLTVPA